MSRIQLPERGTIWQGPNVRTEIRDIDQGTEQLNSSRNQPANVAATQASEHRNTLEPQRPGFFARVRRAFAATPTPTDSSFASQQGTPPVPSYPPDPPVPMSYDGRPDHCTICAHDIQDGEDLVRLSCGHIFHTACREQVRNDLHIVTDADRREAGYLLETVVSIAEPEAISLRSPVGYTTVFIQY